MSADETKKVQRITIDRVKNGFIVYAQEESGRLETAVTPYVCTINNLTSLIYELCSGGQIT